jgi:hypothetical protein
MFVKILSNIKICQTFAKKMYKFCNIGKGCREESEESEEEDWWLLDQMQLRRTW